MEHVVRQSVKDHQGSANSVVQTFLDSKRMRLPPGHASPGGGKRLDFGAGGVPSQFASLPGYDSDLRTAKSLDPKRRRHRIDAQLSIEPRETRQQTDLNSMT